VSVAPRDQAGAVGQVDGRGYNTEDHDMARRQRQPLWEREAPLTPERGDEIYRRALFVWLILIAAPELVICILVGVTVHTTVVTVIVIVVGASAVLTTWLGLRHVRSGIRANTPSLAPVVPAERLPHARPPGPLVRVAAKWALQQPPPVPVADERELSPAGRIANDAIIGGLAIVLIASVVAVRVFGA